MIALVLLGLLLVGQSQAQVCKFTSTDLSYDPVANVTFPINNASERTAIIQEGIGLSSPLCSEFIVNKSTYMKNADHYVTERTNLQFVSPETRLVSCEYVDSDNLLCGSNIDVSFCNLVFKDVTVASGTAWLLNSYANATIEGSLTLDSTANLTLKAFARLEITGDFIWNGLVRTDPLAIISVHGCIIVDNATTAVETLIPNCFGNTSADGYGIQSTSQCLNGNIDLSRTNLILPMSKSISRQYPIPDQTLLSQGLPADLNPYASLLLPSEVTPGRTESTQSWYCTGGGGIGGLFGSDGCPTPTITQAPPPKVVNAPLNSLPVDTTPTPTPVAPQAVASYIQVLLPPTPKSQTPTSALGTMLPHSPTPVATILNEREAAPPMFPNEATRLLVIYGVPAMGALIILAIIFVVMAMRMKKLRKNLMPYKDRENALSTNSIESVRLDSRGIMAESHAPVADRGHSAGSTAFPTLPAVPTTSAPPSRQPSIVALDQDSRSYSNAPAPAPQYYPPPPQGRPSTVVAAPLPPPSFPPQSVPRPSGVLQAPLPPQPFARPPTFQRSTTNLPPPPPPSLNRPSHSNFPPPPAFNRPPGGSAPPLPSPFPPRTLPPPAQTPPY